MSEENIDIAKIYLNMSDGESNFSSESSSSELLDLVNEPLPLVKSFSKERENLFARYEEIGDNNIDDGGFVSKVSTIIENYQRESRLLNEEVKDVPIYNEDLLDPIAPVSRTTTTKSVREATELEYEDSKSVHSDEIVDDGMYNADDIIDPPPDGGYGWVCCMCVVVMNFCTWGPNTCYGIFLSYYLSTGYFKGATPTDYALIGGLMLGLTLFLLPLSAMCMNKFGYKIVVSLAVLLQFVAFLSSSFTTTIGELYFTYGILLGVANGFLFGCNSVVIPGWFLKKRALANGITHIGVGAGGLSLSFAVYAIINKTGSHKWAMRMLGIMALVLNSIAVALTKVRKPKIPPPKKTSLQLLQEVYDFKVYKSMSLQYCTWWSTLTNMGYVILLFSLSNFALSLGLSTQQATTTLALFNGAQIIGRPSMGYFSEKLGRVNYTIICMVLTILFLGPFWFNITTYREIMPFSFLLGLFAGICSVNTTPLVADVTGMAHFPAGLGYNNIWNGAAAIIAEIIGLRLRNYNLTRPYIHCQIFVLCMYFGGLLFLIPYREWKIRRMFNARLAHKNLDNSIRQKWIRLLEPGVINYIRRAFYLIRA